MTELLPKPDHLEIGKIVGAHGIRGELRVHPSTDFPERLEKKGGRWMLRPNQSQPERVQLLRGYYQDGKGLYINAAESLRGCVLMVDSSDRPRIEKGEFLVIDLIGLPVYDQATQTLVGVVRNMLSAGNDLLEVIQEGRAEPILIPFVEPIVPVVDIKAGRIEITPPPGLI
jgi:16S rRNA processing protein RimM